jgi:GGDEF domain-containing protein
MTGVPLTLSIGLTEASPDDDALSLVARADKALYQAKSDGRNCRRMITAEATPETAQDVLSTAPLSAIMIPSVGSTLLQR